MSRAASGAALLLAFLAPAVLDPAHAQGALPVSPAPRPAAPPSSTETPPDPGDTAEDRLLLLEVFVNGGARNAIGTFTERDGVLRAPVRELRNLGIAAPEDREEVALRDIPGLRWEVDEASLQIHFAGTHGALLANAIGPAGNIAPPPRPEVSPGMVLNYDATVTRGANWGNGGSTVGAGFLDARVFSGLGTAAVSYLAYAGTGANTGHDALVRLDATLTRDADDALRQYRLGDVVTGGLAWTRPVRLGGAQLTSNFAMRPDLVTFPVPVVTGTAAVPSTVDVLVNGVRQVSEPTGAGPFVLRQPPVVSGAGEVSVVVRDALGRESVSTLPFYASAALLREGLASYSAEAGFVRRRYGLVSDDYGAAVATGTLRYGWSDWLTAESHVEAATQLAMGGAGAVMTVGSLGTLSISAAFSAARADTSAGLRGATGWQAGLGFNRLGQSISFGAAVLWASDSFADAAALDGSSYPRRTISASLSLPLAGGALSLAYAGVERDNGLGRRGGRVSGPARGYGDAATRLLTNLPSTQLLTASYVRPLFGNVSAYATAFTDLSGNVGTGAIAGLSFPLGSRSEATLGTSLLDKRAGATLQASQATTAPRQYGGQIYATAGGTSRQLAEAEYRGESGRVLAGVDRSGGQTSLRAELRGGITAMDGGVFLSDTLRGGLAVVDTDGVPDITVLQDNRPLGRTNSAGHFLVPDLRPYEANRLSLAPEDLPPDTRLDTEVRMVAPRQGTGMVVRFDLAQGESALLRLTDPAGLPLPVGAVVLGATGVEGEQRFPVGYDGESYVSGLGPENRLRVLLPGGGNCELRFPFVPPSRGDLARLGPIPCR